MTESKPVLLSGVKPTGRPHIGNYFGAIKQYIDLQDKYESFTFIANYHALTSVHNPEQLSNDTINAVIDYLALGVDPKKATIFLQSDVPEVTELAWIFNTLLSVPYLKRAHAYKDAVAKGKEPSMGVFMYPVLMAADILIYNPDIVPVGADQAQHLEIARDIAEAFNRTFSPTFKLPKTYTIEAVETVLGNDGRKMSKSYGNTLPIFATDEEIKLYVMAIKTDSKDVDEPKNPEECHVFGLHKLFTPEEKLADVRRRYIEGSIGYRESKELLIKSVITFITPFRTKRAELMKDENAVHAVLSDGAKRARKVAQQKMEEIRKKVGATI